jgi:two-component system, OmpR family, phosphate regulon sensor histidine kinase PhoR
LAIGLLAAHQNQGLQMSRMISLRSLLGLIIGLAVLLVIAALVFGLPLWLTASGLTLFLGLGAGLLLGKRINSADYVATIEHEANSNGTDIDFSSRLLDTTLNEMREGLLVVDHEMRVVASNRTARTLFSNLDDSINSRRLTELTRNPALYDAFLDALRGIERAGVKVETHGRARRVFDLRVVPLTTPNGRTPNGAVGVFFDVTRLERLELVRQEFLSNVSHEMRTPLTSIIALAETLAAGAIDNHEHNRRFLSIIQKNAARMHRLIDDILELSAIEAGNVKVKPEIVPLYPLVEDVISSLSSAAAARAVTVHNLTRQDARVFADPHRLVQMLTNLIDNAIKFNREGGTVSITNGGASNDEIQVDDTGEGIPSHHLDRLFERFYRVDRARSRELGGTGLGLAIVKHLARAHGGEVTVESSLGERTRFTIELPRITDE